MVSGMAQKHLRLEGSEGIATFEYQPVNTCAYAHLVLACLLLLSFCKLQRWVWVLVRELLHLM